MALEFIGAPEILEYRGEGDITNSCLAVNLSMLGFGPIAVIDMDLQVKGITNEAGVSALPPEEARLLVNGYGLYVGDAGWAFSPDEALDAATAAFAEGRGLQYTIPIIGSGGEEVAHSVLLGGKWVEGESAAKYVVGDSRFDNIQERDPDTFLQELQNYINNDGMLVIQALGRLR